MFHRGLMETIKYFYKNPISWCIVLILIQVYISSVLAPKPEHIKLELQAYEEMVLEANLNTKLVELIEE